MSWSSGHHVMNNMYPGYSPTTHGPMSASVSTHGAFFRYMSSRDMRAGGVKQEVTCLWVEPDQARIDTLSNRAHLKGKLMKIWARMGAFHNF